MKSKLMTALLSIVIAFGLWLYVVTVVNPESENSYFDIPVVFDGAAQLADRDLMITSGTDVRVNLKLSGNRTDLNKLDKTNITIVADLSRITGPGEHNLRYDIFYPSSAGAIEVLNQDPQYITIQVSERIRKEVPVRVNYTGSLPDGFSADMQNAVLDHTTVTVQGPKEVVEQIEYAAISVDLTGQEENIVETVRHTLCGADGNPIEDVSSVTVSVSHIRVTVRVYQIKELPLHIRVEDGGGLTAADVTVTPNRTSIVVSGSKAALADLHEIELLVDLGVLTESQLLTFDITLPEGVTNVSGASQVNVDVQIPPMTTRTLAVTSARFVWINVPENVDIAVLTEMLHIQVRGRANRLEELTAENITVYVDFSNALIGGANSYNCSVEITGVSDVGAVGEYMVWALIATKSDAAQSGGLWNRP